MLNDLLPSRPLLSLDSVPGVTVETLADPFPVSHDGRLFVLAELVGRRDGAWFKTIAAFEIEDSLRQARYLGDVLPPESGAFSFPHVVRDGDRFLMLPEVFVPMEGAPGIRLQLLQIYETPAEQFPFGWTLAHEGLPPGCQAPSDKLLMRRDDRWWLFCSDNAGRQLLLYTASELRDWSPHPSNPLVCRDDATAAEPESLEWQAARAWRLGGGIIDRGGELLLPLQHKHRSASYGGAVSLLRIDELTDRQVTVTRETPPVLHEEPGRPWMAHGAHHVALARHGDRIVLATDGFDGERWTSHLTELPPSSELGPWERT
jgi:hypothetical protein